MSDRHTSWGHHVRLFNHWLRLLRSIDISLAATAVTLVALVCYFAGQLGVATAIGALSACLVYLKHRPRRDPSQET